MSVIANSYHDTNGNVGLGGSTTFTVDTVPPSITIGTIASDNTISASEGANAAGVIISGAASDGVGGTGVDGQTVTVQILNGSSTVVGQLHDDRVWRHLVGGCHKVQGQALTDGSYTVTANVSDAAGNPAPQASQALTVDQDIGEIATLAIAGTADNVLNKTEATTVSFTVGGLDDTGTGTVTFTDIHGHTKVVNVTGNGPYSTDLSSLDDGSIASALSFTDTVGNAANATGNSVTLDTDKTEVATLVVADTPDHVINNAEVDGRLLHGWRSRRHRHRYRHLLGRR